MPAKPIPDRYQWTIATRIEDVSNGEMPCRLDMMMKQ